MRHYVGDVAEQLDAGRGLWFTGDVGTGKTTLAMLISKAAMEADRTVAIYSLPRLLGAAARHATPTTPQYSLNELIDRLCAVDLLHIDDVGAEQTTPWVLEQLYSIVNTRYEDGQGDPADHEPIARRRTALREQIGDRTVSRLYEMCGDPMPMFGADQRREFTTSCPAATPAGARPAPARLATTTRSRAYGEPRPPRRRHAS